MKDNMLYYDHHYINFHQHYLIHFITNSEHLYHG